MLATLLVASYMVGSGVYLLPATLATVGSITVAAPLGLIGVVAALLIFQAPLGSVAILGITALPGMIMRNSVILIDQVREDMERGSIREMQSSKPPSTGRGL